jgi:hypothetical protein
MIERAVDVELARQHWEEGRRRVERARGDPTAYARLAAQVEVVLAELRGRVGQRFTLTELTAVYDGAVEWARDALHEAAAEDDPPPDSAVVTDAAFQVYARGASDYAP